MNEYFSEWFRRTLANRSLSGGEVARAVGVNESAVSRWRNGKGTPGMESAMQLAHFLDVNPIRLAVTVGLLSKTDTGFERLPLPEDTARREKVRAQINRMSDLTAEEKQILIECWEQRIAGDAV